jgi:hypothetical protein
MEPALVKVIGAAVIPAAMITACAVLLQGLWAEHRSLADRIRSCSAELRTAGLAARRRGSLLAQILLFQRRMRIVTRASLCGAGIVTRASLCGTAAVACYVALVMMLAAHDLQRWQALFLLVFMGGAALLLVAVSLLFFDLVLGTRTIDIEISEHHGGDGRRERTKLRDEPARGSGS